MKRLKDARTGQRTRAARGAYAGADVAPVAAPRRGARLHLPGAAGRVRPGELDPSVVYRALRDMEERGLVGSTWDEEETQGPPRRVYHITVEGDEALRLWVQELREARARIDHLLGLYGRHMTEGEGEHH